MKYIIQIALETDLDVFPLEDKLKEIFLPEIKKETFSNHIIVKQCQYDDIEDHFYDLVGKRNHSGGSFHILDKTKPIVQLDGRFQP